MISLRLLLAASLPSVALALPAFAQAEADVENTDEIIVLGQNYVPDGSESATKTDAPLIETPQSVSVITRDQIELLNFIDVQQAVRYSAGVVGENFGPDLRFDFLTQRGFTPVQYIDGLQAPVSSTITNVGVDLYGFESVDILKGPSSVLYGAAPPGGIYNMRSRRPDAVFGGEIGAKYGTEDFKQVQGTITGPLSDRVSARLTGLYRDRGSQVDFVEAERAYVAPAVTLELTPDTTLTGLAYFQHDRVDGDTNGFLPVEGTLLKNPLGEIPIDRNLGEPDYNFYERNQWGAGYDFSHEFGGPFDFSFQSNAKWFDYDEEMQTVYATSLADDNRTVGRSNFPFREHVEEFAVDNRFAATVMTGAVEHSLLAGLDYRDYRSEAEFGFAAAPPIDLFDPQYGAEIGAPPFFPFINQEIAQTGLYLQDQARLENWVLTLAGRQDWVEAEDFNAGRTNNDEAFTYRAGLNYVFGTGFAPYVSYATSFQPVAGVDVNGEPFEPSEGEQIEAGVKYQAETLGDAVDLFATAAVFNIDQTNLVTATPQTPVSSIQTGEVNVKGAELEVVARLWEALNVNAAYAYTDSEVTESNGPDLGAPLPTTPEHTASIFVDYTLQEGSLAGLGFGAGLRYKGESAGSLPGPFNPVVYETPATTLVDAAIHYDFPDWRLAVNASNLLDEKYVGRCNGPVGCIYGYQREVIASVTRRF